MVLDSTEKLAKGPGEMVQQLREGVNNSTYCSSTGPGFDSQQPGWMSITPGPGDPNSSGLYGHLHVHTNLHIDRHKHN